MPLDLNYVADDPAVTNEEVIIGFATLGAAMKKRGIIRTKNITGDLGERYAELIYRTHSNRRPITRLETNSSDIDAKDDRDVLYSIKAASPATTQTSAFHFGRDRRKEDKVFDLLIVVRVDELLQLKEIYEFSWDAFWDAKQWNTRSLVWFMPLSKKALRTGTKIFPVEN